MQGYYSKSGPYSSVHQFCLYIIKRRSAPALHVTEQKFKQLWLLEKKSASKRFRNWKKKFGLGWDCYPPLRWLTTVCLRGFDRNVQQLFTVFSLHQCFQCAIMNEPKQLSISNQHIQVPGWRAFNFAKVMFWCVIGMPSNSVVKTEF